MQKSKATVIILSLLSAALLIGLLLTVFWILPSQCDAARKTGQQDGFLNGYKTGLSHGYRSGHSDGYDAGYDSGYASGYDAGMTDGRAAGQRDYDKGWSSGYSSGLTDGRASAQPKLKLPKPNLPKLQLPKLVLPSSQASSAIVSGSTQADSSTVYVSRKGVIHRRSNCSGMKYYSEMSYDAAVAAGYHKCSKCY